MRKVNNKVERAFQHRKELWQERRYWVLEYQEQIKMFNSPEYWKKQYEEEKLRQIKQFNSLEYWEKQYEKHNLRVGEKDSSDSKKIY